VTLAERLLALHHALHAAGLPHAFGGAIALAYATLEPRGTRDLDVNVFVPAAQAAAVVAALPEGVTVGATEAEALRADGQARLWWDDVPVDVFLDYAPIHAAAARHRRLVPFEGEDVPVLGPIELAVFKAMFDRTKDWADIEAMVAAGALDVASARRELVAMVGPDDARVRRLDAVTR
jgi:hypothetical protein